MKTLQWILGVALCVSACDEKKPAAPVAKAEAPARPSKPEEKKATAPEPTPNLLNVCKAFDEVVAEGAADGVVLQTAAVRASTKYRVSEAAMEKLGARPPDLLRSIRAQGDPEACAGLKAKLESM